MVMRGMFLSFHQNEVLWAVVVSFAIDMMDNFVWLYRSVNYIRHYKNMLSNIAIFTGVRVEGREPKDIPRGMPKSATPIRIAFSPELVSRYKATWESFKGVFVPINKTPASAKTWNLNGFKTRIFGVCHT